MDINIDIDIDNFQKKNPDCRIIITRKKNTITIQEIKSINNCNAGDILLFIINLIKKKLSNVEQIQLYDASVFEDSFWPGSIEYIAKKIKLNNNYKGLSWYTTFGFMSEKIDIELSNIIKLMKLKVNDFIKLYQDKKIHKEFDILDFDYKIDNMGKLTSNIKNLKENYIYEIILKEYNLDNYTKYDKNNYITAYPKGMGGGIPVFYNKSELIDKQNNEFYDFYRLNKLIIEIWLKIYDSNRTLILSKFNENKYKIMKCYKINDINTYR